MYDYLFDLNKEARKCKNAEKRGEREYNEKEYNTYNNGSNYLGSFSMRDILDTYKYTMVGEAW